MVAMQGHQVDTASTIDDGIATPCLDHIVGGASHDMVRPATGMDDAASCRGVNVVTAGAGIDHRLAGATKDGVAAAATGQHIVATATDQ